MKNEIITREANGIQAERLVILECRIRDNMNRVGESALDIGRCLNQAKEEDLVPHGQWQEWVYKHTGMSPRTAQMWMKAAREIAPASPLASLDFSKVQALLSLPSEEREQFAEEVGADSKSVRELKEAIKARQAAEKERDAAKKREQETLANYDRYKDQAAKEAEALSNKVKSLEDELEYALEGGAANEEIERLKEEIEDQEAEILRRAKAEEKAKNELLALKSQMARGFGSAPAHEGLTPDELSEAISAFMGRADVLPYMRTQLATCDHSTRSAFREQVERVLGWCERAMRALDTVTGEVIEG